MKIIKANGVETSYLPEKIVRSLERTGASKEVIQKVLAETEKELFDGIHTKTIYKIVFRNLKKINRSIAHKYHLKNAIMELGPTGFPFEKFISILLEAEGFQTVIDQIVPGRCIKHEVDIVSQKDSERFLMECKFHSLAGTTCGVKDALYVYARFLDIEKTWIDKPRLPKKFHQGWLVTNTRFSPDAEKYGRCVGLGLLSWNYPKGSSLRERIDKKGLYPITCLSSLSKREKALLLEKNIVLCHSLHKNPSELRGIGLSEVKKRKVVQEAKTICKSTLNL
jgi:hypothetical protein